MNRQFKGIWIPARVWLDDRLNATEKVLLAEIDSFESRQQPFYKSNETLSIELGVSVSTIKRAIKHLEEIEYIRRVSFDGRKRAMRSNLEPADRSKETVSKVKFSRQEVQNEPADRSDRAKSKTQKNTSKSTKKEQPVLMPFVEFETVWAQWKQYRKDEHNFRYKSPNTEQAALKKLQDISNNDRTRAEQIIAQSIANGWRGLFPIKGNSGKAGAITSADADKFAEYIRTGNI